MRCFRYRSSFLFSVLAALFTGAETTLSQTILIGGREVTITTTSAWDGATASEVAAGSIQEGVPTDLVQLNDGTSRFLLSTLGGNLHVLNSNGEIQTLGAPLLDPNQTGNTIAFNQRYGFTSIAIHPNFAGNPSGFGYGKAYAIVAQPQDAGVPDFSPSGINATNHQSVVFEYDLQEIVGDSFQNSVGGMFSRRELLRIQQDGGSHNVFDLAINNVGDIFISIGDGTANPLEQTSYRLQYAQNLDEIYGKVIRIHPDPQAYLPAGGEIGLGRISNNGNYSIPDSNPFFGQADALDEIFANGLRSPFRINLDPVDQQVVWLGDVGEGSREEVSRIVSGGNYGWGIFEGSIDAPDPINSNPFLVGNPNASFPEFEYSHFNRPGVPDVPGGGVSVFGGVIYKGNALGRGLQGQYVGAELGNFAGNGGISRIFYGDPNASDSPQDPLAFRLSPESSQFDNVFLGMQSLPNLITSIGEDIDGELYILGLEATTTPGIDEGDGLPGRLVVAKVLPSNAPTGNILIDYRDNAASPGNGDLFSDPLGVVAEAGIAVNNEVIESTNSNGRVLAFNGSSPIPDILGVPFSSITGLQGVQIDGFTIFRTQYFSGNDAYGFLEGGPGRLEPVAVPNDGQAFANSTEVILVSDSYAVDIETGDTINFSFLAGSDSGDLIASFQTFVVLDNTDVIEVGNTVDAFSNTSPRIERTFVASSSFGELAVAILMNGGFGERSFVDQVFLEIEDDSVLLGDINGDGVVNLLDVGPFVQLLADGSFLPEADINQDGVVNLLDVDPFVDILAGG